jgi:hypothetical protein
LEERKEMIYFGEKNTSFACTVKLGYNKLLGTTKICSLYAGFYKTGNLKA